MQGPQLIHCQGVRRRRPGRATSSRMDSAQPLLVADPAFWLPIRNGCIVGTLRSLPYLGGFTLAIQQNLLWVDVSDRPDVFDLGRVLRHEGPGEAAFRRCSIPTTARVSPSRSTGRLRKTCTSVLSAG